MSIEKSVFSGSHYEMGFQQGKNHRQSIQRAINVIFDFKGVLDRKPRFLPRWLFSALAKRRAEKLLKKDILRYYPKQADRLRGIADGASMELSSVLFIQMTEMLFGCTAIAVSSKLVPTREPILAKNFDYLNFTEAYNLTCESRPEEGYKTLSCKFTPLPGTLDGLNEAGLAVTYNLAFSTDQPKIYVPTSLMLQEMLETCKNTQEAVDFILQAKRGGHDALITLVDSTDDIQTVEISSNHAAVRKLKDHYVVNTNHYQTKEMQEYKRSLGYESSTMRLTRAEELLHDKRNIDEKALLTILSDHGARNDLSEFTVCLHAEEVGTLRSIIAYSKTKTLKVLYGHPCEKEYSELKFS